MKLGYVDSTYSLLISRGTYIYAYGIRMTRLAYSHGIRMETMAYSYHVRIKYYRLFNAEILLFA